MAMSFAPLSLKVPIFIENPNVVVKSYPKFWDDLKKAMQYYLLATGPNLNYRISFLSP